MLDSLVQRFAGGEASQMADPELFGNVTQMLQGAPNEHGIGAISQALSSLGGAGFGQSVAQGSAGASLQQRTGLGEMLLHAVTQGGGSPTDVLSQLGIDRAAMGPQELGTLAQNVGQNHPSALSSVLGNQLGGAGGGSSMLSLLGNPMVREVGMNLAKRLL